MRKIVPTQDIKVGCLELSRGAVLPFANIDFRAADIAPVLPDQSDGFGCVTPFPPGRKRILMGRRGIMAR